MRAHGIQSGATLRAGTPGINNMNNNFRADGSAAIQRAPKKRKITTLGEGKDDEEDIKPKTERDLQIKEELSAEGSTPADAESPGTVSVAVAGGGGDGEDDVVVLSTHSYVDDALAADPSQVIPAYGYHTGYGYPLHASQMDAMVANGGADWYQSAQSSGPLVWPGLLPVESQDDAETA